MTTEAGLKQFESDMDFFQCDWMSGQEGDFIVANFVSVKVAFTINRPAARVWKYMKDFGAWMEDLQFNEVVGDQPDGSTIFFTLKEKYHEHYRRAYSFDPKSFKKFCIVKWVIPEKVFVKEARSDDGSRIESYYMYVLHEHGAKTTVTVLMGITPQWVPSANAEHARTTSQSHADEAEERWRRTYIPNLRKLVETNC